MQMSDKMKRRKLIFPYLLIFGIFSISAFILDSGWLAIHSQRQQKVALQRDDEARQILGTMAYGATFNPYLTRITSYIKSRLSEEFSHDSALKLNPQHQFLHSSFPEHEIWAFAYTGPGKEKVAQPFLFPQKPSVSRRGMANAFVAIDKNDATKGNNKLIDFLFGPGLTINNLALRQGRPTRIIYRNQHHLLIWESIEVNRQKAGGFFLLIPDSPALQRFAMIRSAKSANMGNFHPRSSFEKSCFAGYLRVFPSELASIYPEKMLKVTELVEFRQKMKTLPGLTALERTPPAWGKKYGNWELYTRTIPNSPHLAFVFLPEVSGVKNHTSSITAGRLIYLLFAALLLLAFSGQRAPPPLSLKNRFSLLFISLAAIPFSLFLIAANLYLEELKITLVREARQRLHQALAAFDQGVEETYSRYRSELQKLPQQAWLRNGVQHPDSPLPELLNETRKFIQGFSPPVPWGSIMFVNSEGKMVETFRTSMHQASLAGYARFNRIGLIDALRKSNSLPDINAATSTPFITDADVAIKRAFETLLRLPVCHGFVNKSVGQTTQAAFGSFSIIRVFDFFPTALNPKIAFAVVWLEDELDRHFCAETIKKLKREYPGSRFAVYRKQADGLKLIARSHKQLNLSRSAFTASLRNGFSFALPSHGKGMEVAFSSQRRPGVILAGEMDTGFIDEKIARLTQRFFLLAAFGLLSIFYFRRLLSVRLIRPLLLLQKSLSNVQKGRLQKLPEVQRRDEIWKIFTSFNEMLDGLRARQRLLSLVSGNALQIARDRPENATDEENQLAPTIVMVSDIRDFTTLCEKHAPDVITRLLNHHFDHMSQIIYAHGGQISRFVGDAIEAGFPCPAGQREESLSKAAKAGLIMLQTMALINDEREKQSFFTYRIGIGLAVGVSRSIHIGSRGTRSEVLQVGGTLKRAGVLEALSKEFSGLPLVIDAEAGEILIRTPEFAGMLQKKVLGSETVFVCAATPEPANLLSLTTAGLDGNSTNIEKTEDLNEKGKGTFSYGSYESFAEPVRSARIGLLPGLLIILIPFLLCLYGYFHGFERYRSDLNRQAHDSNQRFLQREKSPEARKAMVEMQLQKTIAAIMKRTGLNKHSSEADQRAEWRNCLDRELRTAGLLPEEIIISSWPAPENRENIFQTEKSPARPVQQQLARTLHACLQAYGLQFDRFLAPDDQKVRFLGEAMSGLLLTRDSRGRFETVTIATETFWLYWQPVLNQNYLERLQNGQRQNDYAGFPHEMRVFGRFGNEDHRSLLAGGVLILCRPPHSAGDLRLKPLNNAIFSARLDLKTLTVEDEQGDPADFLMANGSDSADGDRAGKLLSLAYRAEEPAGDWAVDKVVSQGESPKVHLVATRAIQQQNFWLGHEKTGIVAILALMLLAAAAWQRVTHERGMATTVRGQILGSFLGTMLLPVAGLFLVLALLIGDWQENMVKDSVAGFLHQVDMIEQQVGFHHVAAPEKVKKILENAGLNSFFNLKLPENKEDPNFKSARQGLLRLLKEAWQKVLRQSQGLGLNSLMVDAANGLSEFLAIDGTFSPEGDPMKKTFSFHAGRVMDRLAPSRSRRAVDPSRLLVDEMTAQLIFEILDSTFGSDASMEILFGQNRGVDLFSSVSNDVFFQSFFPQFGNPLGTVFTIFSQLHSNIFAVARIMAARHFQRPPPAPLEFAVFAASRLSPGMPLIPETGEALPFLRQAAAESILTGPFEDIRSHNNAEHYVITQPSIVIPQFVFVGTAQKSNFNSMVRDRVLQFVSALLLFFFLLFLLAVHTARDITGPLSQLLDRIHLVNRGNFNCTLSFGRNDELEEIALAFNGMVKQLAEKDLLASMVSESALEMAHSDQAESEAIMGLKRKATVAYFGLVQFDKLSESQTMAEISHLLGRWVESVCAIVARHGGEIDKIMEGKILAVFFADRQSDPDIDRACRAALEVCSSCSSDNLPTSCGIHAGEVISGLMGNQERRDFTIIGDPVNMSARCFNLSERLVGPGSVIAAETTAQQTGNSFTRHDLGTHQIKGKQAAVKIFQIAAD